MVAAIAAVAAAARTAARAAAMRLVQTTHLCRGFAVVLRDGNGDDAAAHFLAVQVLDRIICLLAVLKFDEGEASLFTTETDMSTAYCE